MQRKGLLAVGSLCSAFVCAACSDRETMAPSHTTAPAVLQAARAQGNGGGSDEPRHVVTLIGAEASDFDAAVAGLGGRVERRHADIGVVTVRGLTAAGAQALAARPEVAGVDADITLRWIPRPDQLFRQARAIDAQAAPPSALGTDQSGAFFFAIQWNMQVIQAPAAWAATPAGGGRLVCVLDTGVDPGHVDLAGRVALDKSTSFVEAEPDIQDLNAHGTFVSSLISSNGLGMASVASDARLCAIKVLAKDGSGTFDDVISGIIFAADEGADVINMSLGAYIDLRQKGARGLVRALQKAVDVATRKGVVVVASAGNGAINLDKDPGFMLEIPAQLDGVISVGATGPINQQNFDALASYSNFGGRTGIALVAPGGDFRNLPHEPVFDLVLGACSRTQTALPTANCTSGRSFLLGDGTSFASPHVAGAAAVVESQLGTAGSEQVEHVTECILEGADNVGPRRIFGAGRLNVATGAACPSTGNHNNTRVAGRK
jgi:subtilisin family serine protease